MSATSDRDRAANLAIAKNRQALSQALGIGDAWFACQALAWVLRYAPEKQIARIVSNIDHRAATCRDDYQRAAVRAWEIRALAERGLTREANRVLSEATIVARGTTPAPSRSEALFLLFQAAYPLGNRTVSPLARMLAETWLVQPNWRSERNLVHTLAMVSALNSDEYHSILASVSDDRVNRRVQRAIGKGFTTPRNFFDNDD